MSATMFKAIVWKELRANLKWGVIVLLGMAAGLIYKMQLFADVDLFHVASANLQSVINDLEGTAAFGAILAGLLIGAAQAVVENGGDKWGFLAHRPASRSMLFWGKATAGILLYAISTGVPVAAALFRIATPGYLLVPFDWRIALPVIANLLCGLVCYFAGFLTGMRQARWYASRALGIATAVGCLGLQAATATTFWQAVALCAAGLVMVGTAAWSTFVAGGQYGAQPRIGRIATGLSIGLGMAIAGTFLVFIFVNAFPEYVAPPDSRSTSYAVTTDGVAKITRDNGRIVEVSDLDGRPLERYRNSAPYLNLNELNADVLPARLWRGMRGTPSLQSSSRLFTPLGSVNSSTTPTWHYVHRLGLISAYDSQYRKLIGWMGPDGFSPGVTMPRPFTGRLNQWSSYGGGQILLAFEDAVYRVDLDNRRIAKIFQSEPQEAILDAGSSQPTASMRTTFGAMAELAVISTTRRVIVQLRDGTTVLEVPQDPREAEGYSSLEVFRALRAPGAPIFIWYSRSTSRESHISEFNGAGAAVNSWTIPPTYRASQEPLHRIAIPATITPPIILSLEIVDRMQRVELSLSRPLEPLRWILAILSSLICVVATFLHGRRYAFTPGRLSIWTAAALLLGPLGYLLMLALIEWPALESCPACRKKRIVTREHCEHCGEPFAAPPKDGTEIFEPMPG